MPLGCASSHSQCPYDGHVPHTGFLPRICPNPRGRMWKTAQSPVPGVGIEPTWDCSRGILSPLRLPFRHPGEIPNQGTGGVEPNVDGFDRKAPKAVASLVGDDAGSGRRNRGASALQSPLRGTEARPHLPGGTHRTGEADVVPPQRPVYSRPDRRTRWLSKSSEFVTFDLLTCPPSILSTDVLSSWRCPGRE